MSLDHGPRQSSQEHIKFWQAQDIGQLDLLHATYVTQVFAQHIHSGYAIGIVERGAETFYYRGKTHIAEAGNIVVINPGEVHTGQSVTQAGWTYRMLYPEIALMQRAAQDLHGRWSEFPYFPQAVIRDDELATMIRSLHLVLENSTSALERESYFITALTHLIARHAAGAPHLPPVSNAHKGILRAKEYIQLYYATNISLEQLAAIADLSAFHFARLFKVVIGLPPHAYLIHVRIEQAKRLLALDCPLVQVAVETGFSDQSHLTKRFKRIVGITPGHYQKPGLRD